MKRLAALLTVLLLAPPAAHAQSVPPYEAVLSDGTRIEGDRLTGWHESGSVPHLQGVSLHDAKRQLLWFRNRGVKPYNPSGNRVGFIDFVGGDRFAGHVVGLQPSDESGILNMSAHLLVRPAAPLHVPGQPPAAYAHILPSRIQRVVWGRASQRRLQPGTLYYLDGRQLGFLRLRWQQNSVLLLLKDGTREVELSKIAEVHLPKIDPWQAYYQELAVLSPACRSRLGRLETTGGLIATGSQLRFRAAPYATPQQKLQAIDHLKRLDEQIGKMNAQRAANQQRFERARAIHSRQSTASANQKKAAHQASQKALADMRLRIDNLRKVDAGQFTKKRQQLEQEFRAAEQAMQQRLAAMPADKRDKALKAFRQKQAQLRKRREKSLETGRLKLEKQRKRELDAFTRSQSNKLAKQQLDLQKKVAPYERVLKAETKRWERYLRQLESVKSQRASTAHGPLGHPGSWYHMVQPVWSLDPLWVPFSSIHTRWSFAPQQVPLSRVQPAATVSPPLLPWHLDRNSAGQLLRSGGREHGWGFGVHAYSELSFALPQCAKTFRSRLGLDRIIGAGGCVRARVYVGSIKSSPVYQSPLLIGSKKTVDTGSIQLRLPSKGPKHLILQVDPVHDNRPRGADPLNIRDKLDWLDPQLGLDTAKLQDEVRGQFGRLITASHEWKLTLDKRGVYTWTSYYDETESPGAGRFRTITRAQGQPLRLSREMTIGPADKWLAVQLSLPTGENPRPDAVTLRVGERQVQPEKIPVRQPWQSWPAPLLFGLEEYQGKQVTLELRQPAGGKPLHWQGVKISKKLPQAYQFARILELAGQSNLQVPLALGSVLYSPRMNDQERIALIEIYRNGGIINFRHPTVGKSQLSDLNNVLVGEDWTGGDKTFMAFQKVPSLKSLILVKDSGVSSAAVKKLSAVMPDLEVTRFERTPSREGERCTFWMQNRTGKEVGIYWIDQGGKLSLRVTLDNTGNRKSHYSNVGSLFEAHVDGKRISKFTVTPGRIWEIKPPEK